MKLKTERIRSAVPTGVLGAMAGALLIGFLTVTLAVVGGAGGQGGDDGNGDGDYSGDNEGVGTLPGMSGLGAIEAEGKDDLPSTFGEPSFYLEGPSSELLDALLRADGVGFFTVEIPGGPGGSGQNVRIVFHGDLNLAFDSAVFLHPEVTAGLKVGASFGDVAAAVIHQDRLIARRNIYAESTLPVPLCRLMRLNTLVEGVQLVTAAQDSQRNTIQIHEYAGLVEVRQR